VKDTMWNFTAGVDVGLGSTLILPYGWVSEDFEISQESADDFKASLKFTVDVTEQVRWWSLAMALLLAILALGVCGTRVLVNKEVRLVRQFWRCLSARGF